MNNPEYKWKHFAAEVFLWSVHWYGSTPMYTGLMKPDTLIRDNDRQLLRWKSDSEKNEQKTLSVC